MKIVIFRAVKYRSILHGRVCVIGSGYVSCWSLLIFTLANQYDKIKKILLKFKNVIFYKRPCTRLVLALFDIVDNFKAIFSHPIFCIVDVYLRGCQ